MPGPVSDSYDPEWGTAANADEVREAVRRMYGKISKILKDVPPKYILDVVRGPDGETNEWFLSERELRILRFCCERAEESI